jgi:histone-lysine N-methyltransferase SETMAR
MRKVCADSAVWAPDHTALSVREFLATKQITVLEHPAYSPDLAPIDFFLFPKIKEILDRKSVV